MRTYGRIGQVNGMGGTWVVVTTDAAGYNDNVYLTALVQYLKLNLGESPFYGSAGVPAQPSVMTQVFPDFYATLAQQFFAPFFASLIIQRVQGSFPPVYSISATCHNGALLQTTVAT